MDSFIEQLERINNDIIKDNILVLANVLEKYVGMPQKMDNGFWNSLYRELNNNNIRNSIKSILALAKGDNNSVIYSLAASLNKNWHGLAQMNCYTPLNKRIDKIKKLLCSYVNISRCLLNYDDYIDLDNKDLNRRIFLILGTEEATSDNILVLEEIDRILKIIQLKQSYVIIPVYECNTDQFKKYTKNYNVGIVHFCGHSNEGSKGEYFLKFVDNNMNYKTVIKHISNLKGLAFFNCCHSYEALSGRAKSVEYTITHRGQVDGMVAGDFSSCFYSGIGMKMDIEKSFKRAIANNSYHGYSLVHASLGQEDDRAPEGEV